MQEQSHTEPCAPQERRCASCGAPLDESARYCPSCGRPAERAAPDVDIAGWVKAGWDLFAENIGPAIAIPLVMLGPLAAFAIIGYAAFIGIAIAADALGHAHGGVIVAILTGAVFGLIGLFFALVMPALHVGIYACFLDGMRTGKLTAVKLGTGFRSWWACTWVSAVLGAAMIACIPFTFIIVGIPVFYGLFSLLWLALLRIADRRKGGLEALAFAWGTMRGRLWMMLLFTFLMNVLMSAGVQAMYLGVFVTVPIGMAALTAAYHDLSKRQPGATSHVPRP